MIRKKTVIVLGAGASAPYGLPTGFKLRQLICENDASSPFSPVKHVGAPRATMSAKLEGLAAIPQKEILAFVEAFKRSSVRSIDAFLARRKDFESLGKLIIAFQLCRHEHAPTLYKSNNEDDWYHALWNVMVDGIDVAQALANNQVRIVSFNYDRSLESFLHQATVNTFGLDDESAHNIWSRIDILHPYGVLGNFDPLGKNGGRQYSVDLSKDSLNIAAAGIQIIPEARDDAPAFEKARDWFYWANQICFLGFGFDPLNVKRLGLSNVLNDISESRQSRPRVIASTHGRTDAEIDQIRAMLGVHPTRFVHFQEKNLFTIRKSGVLA